MEKEKCGEGDHYLLIANQLINCNHTSHLILIHEHVAVAIQFGFGKSEINLFFFKFKPFSAMLAMAISSKCAD